MKKDINYEQAFKGLKEALTLLSKDYMDLSKENHSLRHLLWVKHGCSIGSTYMKCDGNTAHSPIDFSKDKFEVLFNNLIFTEDFKIEQTCSGEATTYTEATDD